MAFMRLPGKWRALNNALHRDVGYFFVGMTIIYGVSGIALNHMEDWDPNYVLEHYQIHLEGWPLTQPIKRANISVLLQDNGISEPVKSLYYPKEGILKVFVKNGSVTIDELSGQAFVEFVYKRPLLFEFNYLHYNHAKGLWTWIADIFAVGLIFLALSGLWMVPGKNSFWRRGVWFLLIGILIPLFIFLSFIN